MIGLASLRMWFALAAVLLLSVACGGDDDAEATAEGAQAQTSSPTTVVVGVVCDQSPPIDMAFDESVTSEIQGLAQCFRIEIPAGLTTLAIELTGLTGTINMSVGYGDVAAVQTHTGDFWRSSEEGTADESVVIEGPEAGPYWIVVGPAGFRDSSEFELSVSGS